MPGYICVLEFNEAPPVLEAYHFMPVPVTTKSDRAPLLQNICDELPVGAAGALMVAVTAKRVADSQPLTVCEA